MTSDQSTEECSNTFSEFENQESYETIVLKYKTPYKWDFVNGARCGTVFE